MMKDREINWLPYGSVLLFNDISQATSSYLCFLTSLVLKRLMDLWNISQRTNMSNLPVRH